MELFRAMDSHVEFRLEFCTDSSSDLVCIALPIIDAFVISVRHSLSRAFVTSTMNGPYSLLLRASYLIIFMCALGFAP